MKFKHKRSRRKLNNNFRHVYQNMMAKSNKRNNGAWIQVYNRLVKDLLLDLQDSNAVPSNGYLTEQMSHFKEQAKRMTERSTPLSASMDWYKLIAAIEEADLFWEKKTQEGSRFHKLHCFALINHHGLSASEINTLLSVLGGTHESKHGVIHVNVVNMLRLRPLHESVEAKLEDPLRRLLRKYLVEEMEAQGVDTSMVEKTSKMQAIKDWWLIRKL